jgi:predicted acylesterase/phospholipase RssA
MKGGITSGVVYPAAVAEIAKDFVFKNVGGTSAGAIAAALTAAAERRRAMDGSTAGFERLAAVPDWLASDDHLFTLFAPNAATRALFRTVVGLFGRPRFRPQLAAKWSGLVWAFPVASALGAVPGAIFALTAAQSKGSTLRRVLDFLLAAETIVAGITAGFAIAFARDILREVPKNAFGLVTGIDDAGASNLALSTWLEHELELTAGLEPDTVPLTFGMLWDAKRDPQAPGGERKPPEPSVALDMITTNVTWGRPYQFPLDTSPFFFDPDELARFVPHHVVTWMTARARRPATDTDRRRAAQYGPKLLPLPAAGDLPVILATRMSLAFPVLLSAVPLYTEGSQTVEGREFGEPERLWFSDGGLSSNFPVTLFDSPLPRWPTFGINLAPFPPGQDRSDDESRNVYLPPKNEDGRSPSVSRFGSLPGFFSALFDATQNWNDNTQRRLPGYRDRIVTVFLADDEGGLNLDMPPDLLRRLRDRGAAAGRALVARFKAPSECVSAPPAMNWENHRWLRLRTTMAALKEYLTLFHRATVFRLEPDVLYGKLVRATAGLPATWYPLEEAQRARVAQLIDEIAARGEEIAQLTTLDDELPDPSCKLVLRGHLDS